jgi:hypothetical protein
VALGGASELRPLAAELPHRVTGVASFILLADISDQHLRTLQLNFEGSDQRVFGINDNVFRFPLKFKANRKLHLCALPISVKSSTIRSRGRLGARYLQALRRVAQSSVGFGVSLGGYDDIRRKCGALVARELFLANDVARRDTKEPQAHYALGASLGDWAAGVSGDRETARPRLMHAFLTGDAVSHGLKLLLRRAYCG